MERHGLKTNKKLGQCFLIDENVLHRIARFASAGQEDNLIEIGPGLGPLTQALLECRQANEKHNDGKSGQQYAIEIDSGLVEVLREEFKDQVEIIHDDATRFDFSGLPGQPLALVGNLPYSVTSPLLLHFLKHKHCFGRTCLMIQKEVADRLLAQPGRKTYGSLSVLFQLHADIDRLMDVAPECFWPKPKVRSSVISIQWHKELSVPVEDPRFLEQVVRAAFSQRRKTLKNALQSRFSKEQIVALESSKCIDLKRRAETLNLEEFADLAKNLASIIQ